MKNTRRDFVKTTGFGALSFGLLPNLFPFNNGETLTNQSLPRKSPESQGVSSKGILNFVNAANASGIEWHSFMLLRHGNVIAEGWWKPFEPVFKHSLYSLSKSFTSTAIGFLVDDGKLSVEDSVISFFPDESPKNPSDYLKAMKVKHLLTMTAGHEKVDNAYLLPPSWTNYFLERPILYPPGTHFLYDSQVTYMLGAIVHKLTGQRLDDFLAPRLFQPLGIEGYDWETSPEGLNIANSRLRLKTEDIAKFGQLYLQKGKWKGQQILSKKWISDATHKQTDTPADGRESAYGYGYQFWQCKPNGIYRGDGAYGQLCVVMPEQDAILAVTSLSWDGHNSLKLIWETILPILTNNTLPESPTDAAALKKELKSLTVSVPKGSKTSLDSARYHHKSFEFDRNPFGIVTTQFLFSENACRVEFMREEGMERFEFGWEEWLLNKGTPQNFFNVPGLNPTHIIFPSKIAGTATWLAPNKLQLRVKYVEAHNHDTLTCVFEGETVSISFLDSVSENTKRGVETRKPLTGTLKKSGN
jgi:hypothetical protein